MRQPQNLGMELTADNMSKNNIHLVWHGIQTLDLFFGGTSLKFNEHIDTQHSHIETKYIFQGPSFLVSTLNFGRVISLRKRYKLRYLEDHPI